MPSVVIIHAAEDTLPARALAEKLRQAQLQVVLEKPPGDELRAAVRSAPVTIALWSPRSVQSEELAGEVEFARNASRVLHAQMQSAQTPERFRGDQSVNLTGWRGEDDFAAWRELGRQVTSNAGVSPLPPPEPRPPSGFFQPGRTAPQQTAPAQAAPAPPPTAAAPAPRAQPAAPPPYAAPFEEPKKSGGGMVMVGAIAAIAVVVLGGGGYWYMTQNGAQAASAAWSEVSTDDAGALRAFLAGNPGQYRDEAEQALAALESRAYQSASNSNTIEAYEAFLDEFPDSERATRARGRIAELRLQPENTEVALPELPPIPASEDPDLLPPGTATTPVPETTVSPEPADPSPDSGPQPLTPPADETPAPPPADQPTN